MHLSADIMLFSCYVNIVAKTYTSGATEGTPVWTQAMKLTAHQPVLKLNSVVLMGSTYSTETHVSGVITSVTR